MAFTIIIAALVGAAVMCILLLPKVNQTKKLDNETEQKNEDLRTELLQLTKQHTELIIKKDQVVQTIKEIQQQAEQSANLLYEQSFELANEKMSAAADKMSAEFEETRRKLEQEYLESMALHAEDLNKELTATNEAIKSAETQLTDLSAKVQAAIEAAKRQEEIEAAQDFYKLNLSQIDIEEIKKLRQVTVLLRDSEPLNKVIWKVYYEKPYTDLIGRVVGNGTHTGIYKITNLENQKCYVGQAVKYWPMKNFTRLLSRVRLMDELTGKI